MYGLVRGTRAAPGGLDVKVLPSPGPSICIAIQTADEDIAGTRKYVYL